MRHSGWPRSASALTAILAAVLPLALGAQTPRRSTYEELNNFSGVLNFVRLNYPDTVAYSDLVAAAIRGLLLRLDPHSSYFSRVEWERMTALDRGELATTGIRLESVEGVATVLTVSPRSPAAKAGVQPGDRLLALNDTTVGASDVRAVELQLAGEKGSRVRLRFERGPRLDPDTFSVSLKRAIVEIRSVSTVRLAAPTTGYVRLEEFGIDAAKEVRDALRTLRGEGAQRFILDLRGNPGGLVTAAVDVAAEFFAKNTVVFRTRGRKKDVDSTFVTRSDGDFRGAPLIVLVDEGSASASEALAGSLQDHDRALILGRRSFGKALMQAPHLLASGDMVMLTVGRVLTPTGRYIQRRYRGLGYEQYLSFAGQSGAGEDTAAVFRTDNGRAVRGGGGITPDVVLAGPPAPPRWWGTAVADSAFDDAVADSVAHTLASTNAARTAWVAAHAEWQARLLPPFLARVRGRLGVATPPDSALEQAIARVLAARVAEVRWGPEARDQLIVGADPDIRAAVAYFTRLTELLAPPSGHD